MNYSYFVYASYKKDGAYTDVDADGVIFTHQKVINNSGLESLKATLSSAYREKHGVPPDYVIIKNIVLLHESA